MDAEAIASRSRALANKTKGAAAPVLPRLGPNRNGLGRGGGKALSGDGSEASGGNDFDGGGGSKGLNLAHDKKRAPINPYKTGKLEEDGAPIGSIAYFKKHKDTMRF